MHRNDLENIPAFLACGLLFVTAQPPHEQAHVIQAEVIKLMEDVDRLDERVRKLASHFGMVQKDVDQILTSAEKVTKRGRAIEAIGLSDAEPERQLLAGE